MSYMTRSTTTAASDAWASRGKMLRPTFDRSIDRSMNGVFIDLYSWPSILLVLIQPSFATSVLLQLPVPAAMSSVGRAAHHEEGQQHKEKRVCQLHGFLYLALPGGRRLSVWRTGAGVGCRSSQGKCGVSHRLQRDERWTSVTKQVLLHCKMGSSIN